jgi:hypothetical protein
MAILLPCYGQRLPGEALRDAVSKGHRLRSEDLGVLAVKRLLDAGEALAAVRAAFATMKELHNLVNRLQLPLRKNHLRMVLFAHIVVPMEL